MCVFFFSKHNKHSAFHSGCMCACHTTVLWFCRPYAIPTARRPMNAEQMIKTTLVRMDSR